MNRVHFSVGLALTTLAAVALAAAHPAQASVVDSVNANKTPPPFGTWAANEVGWQYTPSFSYDLSGILTKFAAVDNRTVTAELYNGLPTAGGVLLGSGAFTPSTGFAGGAFANLPLTAGHAYFVGFRGVGGLGVNVTENPGATYLSDLHYDGGNSGSYTIPEVGDFTGQPILEFEGSIPSPAPEPGSLALLATGGLPLLGLLRRRLA
jgi:hypothetical protein